MNCVYDARVALSLTMGAHALMFQGMRGNTHVLHPFIHHHKPHPGQMWVARNMFKLLVGSKWTYGEKRGGFDGAGSGLAQDRYSLRCLPQYLGPLVDGLSVIARQVETEANSATDNPLFDGEGEAFYEGGNFLGQYIGVAMDQLRFYLGLMAKQLDTQIAMLVAPEFNNGLPPSLVGNGASAVNMGLKGLQLTGNSIVPELLHLGTPLVNRFQTHAEQFNQNVNSLGFGAANLARRSIYLSHQYLAVALMFGVQAADLRAYRTSGHYDGRDGLSPATLRKASKRRISSMRIPETPRNIEFARSIMLARTSAWGSLAPAPALRNHNNVSWSCRTWSGAISLFDMPPKPVVTP